MPKINAKYFSSFPLGAANLNNLQQDYDLMNQNLYGGNFDYDITIFKTFEVNHSSTTIRFRF